MIDIVLDKIMQTLADSVYFFDRTAGLVRPQSVEVQKKKKVFPVYINTPTTCSPNDYFDLVPNSSKQAVSYFELNGNPDVQFFKYYSIINQPVRLVVWYNLNKITAGDYLENGSLAQSVLSEFPYTMPDSDFVGTQISKVITTFNGMVQAQDLFKQYTYDEVKNQYLTFPYGAFGLDFTIQFVGARCQTRNSVEDGCEAGMGNHNNAVV